MNQAIQHRGDTEVQYKKITLQNSQIFLGHILLQIKDFSEKAYQPFFSENRKQVIIFNGEIYNYQNLKKSLSKKYHFKTETDTEVLLYYLMENGEKALNDLEGMFAFVFLNLEKEEIIVGRDEHFIKPLFFFESEKYLVISSEIRGILASGLVEKKCNFNQIPHYLIYKFAQKPFTFFENIFEVKESFSFDLQSLKKTKIEIQSKETSLKFTLQTFENTLLKSIESHWGEKLPVGIFLSGGVDSTLLLALARKLLNEHQIFPDKIHTFSVGFDEKTHLKDADFASIVAQKFDAEHHKVIIPKPTFEDFKKVILSLDQPIADSAFYLTYQLSKYAKEYVKIVFSGAGADEIFAGYRRHQAFFQYLKYKSFLLKMPLESIAKNLGLNKDFLKFFSGMEKSEHQTFLNFTASGFSSFLKNPLKNKSLKENFSLENALLWDRKNYLASDVLALTDQMSMQHSLEVRLPYLDNTLIELAKKIPAKQHIKPKPKWILKKILAEKGGEKFAYRKKQGFGMPLKKWLYEIPEVFDFLRTKQEKLALYLPIQDQQKILNQSPENDFSQDIWALLTLQIWLEHHFE